MYMRNNVKALSTIIWLILILCSIIFGALLSYMWVLGNFYAEPVNSINLVVTNATFPINHADRFNITVLNTSNSIGLANITQIYVTPEGLSGLLNVTDTAPNLPMIVDRGVTKTIQCRANWGQFSGDKLLVHLVTPNATITSPAIQTKPVVIDVLTYFNPTISVQYFNASITNDATSAINVTISDILLDNAIVNKTVVTTQGSNATESLPKELDIGNSILVKCLANWTGHSKPTVRVETQEGYFGEATKNVSASVGLLITNVTFDVVNPNAKDFNITLSNAASSATSVNLTNLILTTENNTKFTCPLNFTLSKNQTKTANITWPWKNYRNKSLSLIANTTQGFTSQPYSVNTPQTLVFDFTPTFNLTDTGHFRVNVTNEACSLQSINVTGVKFNQNNTTITPASQTITSGANELLSVAWNWVGFKGQRATVTINTNGTNISKNVTLPAVDLRLTAHFFNSSLGIPYANVTITNNANSTQTVTITQISFTVNATTFFVDGTITNPTLVNGQSLATNSTVTVVCPWNWMKYSGKNVITTVQTKEGFTATSTVLISP